MIRNMINGFCMALADSVPGVSGGTIAFIMGFYDRFIGSIDALVFGTMQERREALRYLIKLGIGWVIGMVLAVSILSSLFESHIYTVSSAFIGFIAASIPLIIAEEKESMKNIGGGISFALLGAAFVIGISWMNGRIGSGSMDLAQFSSILAIRLFFIGMLAISAMFLPGISGSTLLLIFGAYIPVITAVKGMLTGNIAYLPCLIFFGCGILTGAATIVKGIKLCLERFRTQTVYAIVGMMAGSFYAIAMGPTTLKVPCAPLSADLFHLLACVIGIILVLLMQLMKDALPETK